MSARERNLAIILIGVILLFAGGAVEYVFVWSPIQSKNEAAAALQTEIDKKQAEWDKVKTELTKLNDIKRRSLPADVAIARREYPEVMNRLLLNAKVSPATIRIREVNPENTGTPILSGKKPTYTKLVWEISFERADMWNIQDFLLAYYKLPLLHQITLLDIKTDAQPASTTRGKVVNDRRDLVVKILTEAILLDGADNRRSLLSVPNAFAAIGGMPGLSALVLTPEASRGFFHGTSDVLASKPRDYSLIVQNDIFHGPLPLAPSMSVERIADVTVEVDAPIPPMKVRVAGDVGPTGKYTLEAKAEGKILTGGSVKIDQTTRTISIEPMEGETGSGEITVTARTAEGKEAKTKFKVKVTEGEKVKETPKKLPDISDAIKLIIASTNTDGTAIAVIRDNFNPFTYDVEVSSSGRIKVVKYFYPTAAKKRDRDYLPDEPSHLVISDENISATKRTFQVVAMDSEGLYVLELKTAKVVEKEKEKEKPKGGPPGKGAQPVKPPVKPVAALPAATDALSLVVGAAVIQGHGLNHAAAESGPVLYRWGRGQSLKSIKEVPKDEAKKILERVKVGGPLAAN
jgi:hypothetical protein